MKKTRTRFLNKIKSEEKKEEEIFQAGTAASALYLRGPLSPSLSPSLSHTLHALEISTRVCNRACWIFPFSTYLSFVNVHPPLLFISLLKSDESTLVGYLDDICKILPVSIIYQLCLSPTSIKKKKKKT